MPFRPDLLHAGSASRFFFLRLPVNIQLSKILECLGTHSTALSHGPEKLRRKPSQLFEDFLLLSSRRLVGLGRVELPTSPLSGVRSNQLSYRPRELVELIGIEPTTS